MDATKIRSGKSGKPNWQESIQQINTLLVPCKEILIIVRPHPDYDSIASSISLCLAFKKTGRRCQIVSHTAIESEKVLSSLEQKDIPGAFTANLDQIIGYLPKKQLLMTVDYINGSFSAGNMEKTPAGLVFTLSPEENQPPIEPLNVNTQIIESQPDVVVTIGMENLFVAEQFYRENQDFFNKTTIINIDNHANNMYFGKANLVDQKASSLAEMITLMLYDLRFVLDEDVSKLLHSGIRAKTENFSPKHFSANMLEATSISMRYQNPKNPPNQL